MELEPRVKHGVQIEPQADPTESEIAALLEAEQNAQQVEVIDLQALKRMVLTFEKKISKNQKQRMKYSEDPTKFMESELELHQEIQKLQGLAAVPELYPDFVRLNAVSSVLGLLSHENTDICISVVELLHELTDPEAVDDDEDAVALVNSIVENLGLELLVQNLSRMDEASSPEDATAVHHSLGIMENMMEFVPELNKTVVEKAGLLQFLLKRVQVRDFDDNKLYASEILAILLQSSSENREKMKTLDGIDVLLRGLASYKKKEPATPEELEMVENLFNCLCAMLLEDKYKETFNQSEGVELMVILASRGSAGIARSAMKILDYALQRHAKNSERFVESLGLKTLFGMFMGKIGEVKGKKRKREGVRNENDEHVCSVLVSLLRNLSSETLHRVHRKFLENDFEKVDRLVELHERYHGQIQDCDSRKKRKVDPELELDEEMLYLDRLEKGLFSLQLVDQIIAIVAGLGPVKKRLFQSMYQQNIPAGDMVKVLEEYAETFGEDASQKASEKECILQYVKNLQE